MTQINFNSPARVIGMLAPNEWMLEIQNWPEDHWVGHSNGVIIVEQKHILGNTKVGDTGSLSFDKDRDLLWQFIPFISS